MAEVDPLIGMTFHFDAAPAARDPSDVPRGGMGSQVLPVGQLRDDFDGEPEDGMEYLFLVRREAKKHRNGTRAQFEYADEEQEEATDAPQGSVPPEAPPNRPSESWRLAFLAQLTQLRKRMASAPHVSTFPTASHASWPPARDEGRWKCYINGKALAKKPTKPAKTKEQTLAEAKAAALASLDLDLNSALGDEAQEAATTTTTAALSAYDPAHLPHSPTPAMITQMHQELMMKLLEHFITWFEERQEAYEDAAEADEAAKPSTMFKPNSLRRKPTGTSTPAPSKTSPSRDKPRRRPPLPTGHELNWILSILSKLNELQEGNEIGTLRTLARTVTEMIEQNQGELDEWREGAGAGTAASDAERIRDEDDAEACAKGWMVVAAIAGVWKQDDLWNTNL